MYPVERQAAIIASAQSGDGEISVTALSEALNVTPETIRRDLAVLERQGVLNRKHGGARLTRELPFEVGLAQRDLSEGAEKRRIGLRILQELPPDGVVLLDSGSLTLALARLFPEDRDLIVVTNNLAAVPILAAKKGLTVMALPGRVRAMTQGAVDEWTRSRISSLNVDLVVLGANGLSAEEGATTTIPEESEVKRAMLLSARRRILGVTSSKIGQISFSHVAACDEFDLIVTDSRLGAHQQAQLRAVGAPLVVV